MHSAIAHNSLTNDQSVPEMQPSPPPTPPVVLFSMTLYGPGHLLGQCGSAVLVWYTPIFLPAGKCEKLKNPSFSVSIAKQQLKHLCVVKIILIFNPKHSTISATKRKIIPAETRTKSLEKPKAKWVRSR